jgi:hypothetical protein
LGECVSIETSLYVNNSLFVSSLFYHFAKKNISMEMWELIKLEELPWHNALGFFCRGRSLKTYIEIKRELFT